MNYNFTISDVMNFAESKSSILGWKACGWEKVGDDSIVTGSVPTGTYRSGPRKGRPKFAGPESKVIVTRAELEAHAAAHESNTGKCWDCKGSGQTIAGWSKDNGTRYETCSRCKGTGIVSISDAS
jgi:hypothetical protein